MKTRDYIRRVHSRLSAFEWFSQRVTRIGHLTRNEHARGDDEKEEGKRPENNLVSG